MGCKLLCLTLLALLHGCLAQKCTLITPNILRLESEETIVVDGHDTAFEAIVEIQDFPKRFLTLAHQKISLNNDNKFLGTATVKIPSNELTKDPQKYVYVMVKSSVCNIEKVVLLSYRSGYAFIQTDKTIYAPGSTVLFRIFSMNYKMSPMNTNLIIEFLTPENIIVNTYARNIGDSGIDSLSFRLPEVQSLGVWTISAKYVDTSVQICSTNFEVKEFVPPSYEIILIPEKKYFYVDDTELTVNIKAKFLHGGPVNGMAFVIFGVNKGDAKASLPNTQRWIPIRDGEGVAVLLSRDLVKNFKSDDDMLEYTIYMSITLITPADSFTVIKDVHLFARKLLLKRFHEKLNIQSISPQAGEDHVEPNSDRPDFDTTQEQEALAILDSLADEDIPSMAMSNLICLAKFSVFITYVHIKDHLLV